MAKKKVEEEEDFEDEEEEEMEDDSIPEETFKCRVCGKETETGDGDDMIAICDRCAVNYNIDKIWEDFDREKILEENLKKFNLEPYLLKKKKASGPKK